MTTTLAYVILFAVLFAFVVVAPEYAVAVNYRLPVTIQVFGEWFVYGLAVGLPLGLKRHPLARLSEGGSRSIGEVKSRRMHPLAGPVLGLGIGFPIGLLVGFLTVLAVGSSAGPVGIGHQIWTGIWVGIVVWFGVGSVIWLLVEVFDPDPAAAGMLAAKFADDKDPQGPRASWRNDQVSGIVVGLVSGFSFALVIGLWLVLWHGFGIAYGVRYGFALWLAIGLVYGITSSVTWPTTLAWQFQLQPSYRLPAVRLMRFLEDARDRGVLRTVGAVYQFRHALLQDQLAEQTAASLTISSAAKDPS